MASVWLVHGSAIDSEARAAMLRKAGYIVTCGRFDAATLARLKADPPNAVAIDLARAPGQGRDVALAIRQAKATRQVPIVFVDGDSDVVARIKALLPDALYATWPGMRTALRTALARPPASPIVPQSLLAGYSGTPLPKKLGVTAESVVLLVGAPKDFERVLGPLPAGARLTRRTRNARGVTLWFVRSLQELQHDVIGMIPYAANGGLWIVWPKKASALASDVTQTDVRRVGLAAGMVDFKVAAIDQTWAGLRFSTRRRRKTPA